MILTSLVDGSAMRTFAKPRNTLATIAADITGEDKAQSADGKPNIGYEQYITYII